MVFCAAVLMQVTLTLEVAPPALDGNMLEEGCLELHVSSRPVGREIWPRGLLQEHREPFTSPIRSFHGRLHVESSLRPEVVNS